MELYDEFFTIIPSLNDAGIDYAIVGGIALAFHKHPRFTRDIDIACATADITKIENALRKSQFFSSTDPWKLGSSEITMHRFLKTSGEDHLVIDILASQTPRFLEMLNNVIIDSSDAGDVRLARKEDLIWLKSLRGSEQDQVDINLLSDDTD